MSSTSTSVGAVTLNNHPYSRLAATLSIEAAHARKRMANESLAHLDESRGLRISVPPTPPTQKPHARPRTAVDDSWWKSTPPLPPPPKPFVWPPVPSSKANEPACPPLARAQSDPGPLPAAVAAHVLHMRTAERVIPQRRNAMKMVARPRQASEPSHAVAQRDSVLGSAGQPTSIAPGATPGLTVAAAKLCVPKLTSLGRSDQELASVTARLNSNLRCPAGPN
ncbi:hypothetical protein EXIGLDRAFT_760056 [Exidia glandulosa HHB12029]|uniref:Uncharacterized protein n=1 Tax=Exidia glandulosa HHB12029 TaxID=1314781 RepID=A0A165PI56_EXIGL|nr:hypothetical protein EXIGLDRAFT_760056 [Exidia glandulosa HHB12029]